ncbi:hypothetical protein [Clostridium sp.]|uniref:hypothetical protein n=1 Tax=Clostridium sp. TaxID=1506 RepID=UPI0026375374|nr:hypothetical protein [Clostridium sp.]
MKAIVRDDIIALDSFVAAEFKYKAYLEMLMKSGNYCFLDQFKKLINGGQTIVNGMIENNLIGMENINKNYKYIYLSDTAMKYLYLKDSEEDYSNVTKNRISVKKVNKNPTEKQLLSSAYKFHLLANGEDLIDKESIMISLEDFTFLKRHTGNSEIYNNWYKNNKENIKNIKVEIETLKIEKDEFENNMIRFNKGLGLFDSSKEYNEYLDLDSKCRSLESDIKEKSQKFLKAGIKELNLELESLKTLKDEVYKNFSIKNKAITNLNELMKDFNEKILNKENEIKETEEKFNRITKSVEEVTIPKVKEVQKVFENLYNISKVIARIKDNKLEFIILDNGNFKTAYGYLKQINSIKSLDLGLEEVKIIIYSYAEHRSYNLYNEFIKAKEAKIKAQKTMRNFNVKTDNASNKPDFYIAAEKIYNNTPNFEVETRDDFFYMKKYMEFISSSTKSIKRKDKKAIDDLVERLKGNE